MTPNTDSEEGPGLLLSGWLYVLGCLAAVLFWTLIAVGLDALTSLFEYWRNS